MVFNSSEHFDTFDFGVRSLFYRAAVPHLRATLNAQNTFLMIFRTTVVKILGGALSTAAVEQHFAC